MYNVRLAVGNFFEQKVMQLFNLTRNDSKSSDRLPDLIARDGSFCVEVKSSAYSNGGVIKETQLYGFDRIVNARRFYAFVYHSITKDMQKTYPTESKLREALDLKSLFLFPLSIVKAHFEKFPKRNHPQDRFTQLKESLAIKIFQEDPEIWQYLGLKSGGYQRFHPHEKVHIITKGNNLKQKILELFNKQLI